MMTMLFLHRARSTFLQILRWSERYTKTDVLYLISGGFWSVIGQIVAGLSTLILAMFVSRYLPKDIYGEYKFILAAVGLLSTLALNSLGNAVLQSTAKGFDGSLTQGFKTNLKWSTLMFVGAFAVSAYYFAMHNIVLAVGILIGGCLTPFFVSAGLAGQYLAGKKDFARQTLYFGVNSTLISVASLVVTILLTKSALALALVYFCANTLSTLYFYYRVLKLYKPDPLATDPGMVRYGLHLSILGVFGSIVSELDQILLFHFVGPVELAIYNFAIGIPDQIKGPMKTLDSMVQVRFVNRDPANIRENMHKKMLLLFLFALLVVATYFVAAPYLFAILFPIYRDAVPYTQVYILSFFSLIFAPSSSYLSSKKLVREIYINTLISYGLQAVGMFIGVVGWGLWGLIWAIVLIRFASGLCGFILYLIASRHPSP